MPEVTVIIATYNCSKALACAVRSVVNQTYSDFEVWVVGDGCTDDSEQVVGSFEDARLHWVNLPHRVGSQSGPNNEGLRRARGEYIAYLGHDDLWFPWHLETLVAALKGAQVDFTHAVVACLYPAERIVAMGAPDVRRSYASRFIPPSGWLHRRAMINRTGGWPAREGMIGGVDFVLQRRASLAGCSFAATGRLSVLKYPSPQWKTYALGAERPQKAYLERMRADPRSLHEEILTTIVLSYTREQENLLLDPALKMMLRAFRLACMDGYGLDRWPLSNYLAWKHARWRRRAVSLRGLR